MPTSQQFFLMWAENSVKYIKSFQSEQILVKQQPFDALKCRYTGRFV